MKKLLLTASIAVILAASSTLAVAPVMAQDAVSGSSKLPPKPINKNHPVSIPTPASPNSKEASTAEVKKDGSAAKKKTGKGKKAAPDTAVQGK